MKEEEDFNSEGRLVAVDAHGCSFELLNSPGFLLAEASRAAEVAHMKVLAITIVPFQPQGLSLTLTLGESHLTIHTAPELGYAAIDVFTCGGGNAMKAAKHLMKALNPRVTTLKSQRRGALPLAERLREPSTVAR
jgi:S-adenosylmethionine decarboxylase